MAAKLARLTQTSNISASSGRELYHLQCSLEAASPEIFGYALVGNGKHLAQDRGQWWGLVNRVMNFQLP